MKKRLFLFINIFFLILIVMIRFYISNSLVFKENFITQKKFNKIISERIEYKGFLELKYNGHAIPFDKKYDYFLLSQIDEEKYNGAISIDGFEIDVLETNKAKQDIIKENGSLTILAYNKDFYKVINLKLTSFPVMKLDNYLDKVVLFDNDVERNVLNIQNHKMEYHIRGASTSGSEKPSYKLNILNSNGTKKKVSFLNMREDDDWILNSMTTDRSYMLEKIGYELYNQIGKYDIELKYIELFIDNEYRGIYLLQEPADFKTYDADKNKSLLVSIKGWPVKVDSILYDENLEYKTLIDEFELDSQMKQEEQIELLRVFVKDLRNNNYSSDIKLKYDIESFVNHSLFINMISAVDNIYKNQKILFRYHNGEYIVESHPWDLDRSQNNENIIKEENFIKTVENVAVPKNIYNSQEYKNMLKNKYWELRESVYNIDYIESLVNFNKSELEKTGAILREEMRWGDRDLNYSVQNIKDFYSKKIELLDKYYGGT